MEITFDRQILSNCNDTYLENITRRIMNGIKHEYWKNTCLKLLLFGNGRRLRPFPPLLLVWFFKPPLFQDPWRQKPHRKRRQYGCWRTTSSSWNDWSDWSASPWTSRTTRRCLPRTSWRQGSARSLPVLPKLLGRHQTDYLQPEIRYK